MIVRNSSVASERPGVASIPDVVERVDVRPSLRHALRMFWHLILVLFSPVYLMFGLVFRDDRARLVVALYQQVLVLQRHVGKRPSLVKGERCHSALRTDPPSAPTTDPPRIGENSPSWSLDSLSWPSSCRFHWVRSPRRFRL